jgi:polyhydroxyalkanoate synthesis repressor PhaR
VGSKAPSARLIRRYENRKLYDTKARRYVTLDDLARIVERGEEIKVVDQVTSDDISTVVLAQVILEGLKRRTAEIPRGVLERVIRWSGLPSARPWGGPQEAAAKASSEVQRIVSGLLGRGRLTLEEALALRQEVADAVLRIVTDAQKGLEGALQGLLSHSKKGSSLSLLKERLMSFDSVPSRPRGTRRKVQGKRGKRKES